MIILFMHSTESVINVQVNWNERYLLMKNFNHLLILVSGIVCLYVSGCMKIGHRMLQQDRFNYAEAIGEASKRQALLNIVKIRYSWQ